MGVKGDFSKSVFQDPGRSHRASVVHIGNGDSGAGVAGMYHTASADVHGYMVDMLAAAIENQVSRLHVADADLRAAVSLGSG